MTLSVTAKAKISISTTSFNADPLLADYVAASWQEIGEVVNLGTFGPKGKDITSIVLSDGYVRRLKGSIDSGVLNLDVNRDPFDDGQIAAKAAAADWNTYLWKVELNDSPTSTGTDSLFYFRASVMSAENKLEGADNIVTTMFSLGITGEVLEVPATVPITFSPAAGALPGYTSAEAYSETIAATGGLGTVTYSVGTGALPSGVTLNAATGVVSGTYTGAASFTFTIEADFSGVGSASAAYTLAAA